MWWRKEKPKSTKDYDIILPHISEGRWMSDRGGFYAMLDNGIRTETLFSDRSIHDIAKEFSKPWYQIDENTSLAKTPDGYHFYLHRLDKPYKSPYRMTPYYFAIDVVPNEGVHDVTLHTQYMTYLTSEEILNASANASREAFKKIERDKRESEILGHYPPNVLK